VFDETMPREIAKRLPAACTVDVAETAADVSVMRATDADVAADPEAVADTSATDCADAVDEDAPDACADTLCSRITLACVVAEEEA
jgi:hypothetical protein